MRLLGMSEKYQDSEVGVSNEGQKSSVVAPTGNFYTQIDFLL